MVNELYCYLWTETDGQFSCFLVCSCWAAATVLERERGVSPVAAGARGQHSVSHSSAAQPRIKTQNAGTGFRFPYLVRSVSPHSKIRQRARLIADKADKADWQSRPILRHSVLQLQQAARHQTVKRGVGNQSERLQVRLGRKD